MIYSTLLCIHEYYSFIDDSVIDILMWGTSQHFWNMSLTLGCMMDCGGDCDDCCFGILFNVVEEDDPDEWPMDSFVSNIDAIDSTPTEDMFLIRVG